MVALPLGTCIVVAVVGRTMRGGFLDRRKMKGADVRIPEVSNRGIDEGAGALDQSVVGGSSMEAEGRRGEMGVAVGGGEVAQLAIAPGMPEHAVAPDATPGPRNRRSRAAMSPIGARQGEAGIHEGGDGQAVPVGENLVVEAGRHASPASVEECPARRR